MLGLGLPSIEPALWTLMFTMVRVGAAFIAAPVFSAVAVPVQVRILLSAAIGVLVMTSATIEPPAQIFSLMTFLAVAQEALVGLALGFIIQIAFAAPLIASEAIGGSMGIGFAPVVDPANGTSTPSLGNLLSIVMTLLFLALVVGAVVSVPPTRYGSGRDVTSHPSCDSAVNLPFASAPRRRRCTVAACG